MGITDRLKTAVTGTPREAKLDPKLQQRLDKGRTNHKRWKAQWAECLAFVQGRQFVYRTATNKAVLNELEVFEGGTKSVYRARQSRNRILGFVLSEISAATQRTPQYDVTPTSGDPDSINAASVSERVLGFLYDFLKLRTELVFADYYAVVCGEGFLRPYWNRDAGRPIVDPEDPEAWLHEGDVAVEVLGPHEVFWEPGLRFEKSPWHAIETAKTLDEVKALPGFREGIELRPDVRGDDSIVTGALHKGATKADMILVTEYLELPCKEHPQGRVLIVANNQVVCDPQPYPCRLMGPRGYEPALHKVVYIPTPDRDRDMGLVEHMLDAQRTMNDATNKQIELKNIALNLPIITGPAGLKRPYTLEPGAHIVAKGGAGDAKWMAPPDAGYMVALSKMRDEAIQDMEEMASQRAPSPQVESGKGLAVWVERDNMRRQFILAGLVDFHSRVGRHLLTLVQDHYTEPRTLQVAGRDVLDYLYDFKGADIRGQTTVRVLPASIEPRTRESINQQVMNYAQLGWIDPKRAMAAIEAGTAEALLDDARDDEAKQHREIQAMLGLRDDVPGEGGVPTAMEFDNHDVHLGVLHKWMKSKDWEQQEPYVKEASIYHEQQHRYFQQLAAVKAQAEQAAQAQQLGQANATRPAHSPMPSLPAASDGA